MFISPMFSKRDSEKLESRSLKSYSLGKRQDLEGRECWTLPHEKAVVCEYSSTVVAPFLFRGSRWNPGNHRNPFPAQQEEVDRTPRCYTADAGGLCPPGSGFVEIKAQNHPGLATSFRIYMTGLWVLPRAPSQAAFIHQRSRASVCRRTLRMEIGGDRLTTPGLFFCIVNK